MIDGQLWWDAKAPGTTYHFDGGLLKVRVIQGDTLADCREYDYRIQRDTVYLTALIGGAKEKWAVWMFDNNDAQITAWPGPRIFRIER